MNQRFEVISFDLFGPLPPTEHDETWILIIEDVASRWVELFSLKEATAENCAFTLINEVFLRYGVPRRLISDNGTQFVSAIMQQVTYCLGIKHSFTPLYHPESNPVERRNRDLKTQLAIMINESKSRNWSELLPAIRFAMNTSKCISTNYTSAYLTFGRELRAPYDNEIDFRQILILENIIPEITPKLLKLANNLIKMAHQYKIGDLVLLSLHPISKASKGITAKFAPRRDGPYQIMKQHGPASYQIATTSTPDKPIGIYHASALTPFHNQEEEDVTPIPEPVRPLRKRGRPRKDKSTNVGLLPKQQSSRGRKYK
ncbi:hypothetical protein K1T71_014812 [Dendrolimus kikuchii]|nr:hypothetical protein K1T71_014812 [Dendrolimus kikuchii]